MSFKEKVKSFGKAILSIPIGLVIAIPCIISLSLIPIISIFDSISEVLIKFPFKKKFTASDSLKKELKKLRDDSLPHYPLLFNSNKESSNQIVPESIGENIARFREYGISTSISKEEIKCIQDKDEITEKLLYGYHRLDNDAFTQDFEELLFEEGRLIIDSKFIERMILILMLFCSLFLISLEFIGLKDAKILKEHPQVKELIEDLFITFKTAMFDLLKSKVSMLLNRSAIKKEVTKRLHSMIFEHIASGRDSDNYSYDSASDKHDELFRSMMFKKGLSYSYSNCKEANKKIVEKLTSIFSLLTNVKLDLKPKLSKEEFEKRFNDAVYDLREYSTYGMSYNKQMCSGTSTLRLEDKEVQCIQEEFSDFLDNLLENKVLSGLSKEEQADYINILCTKMLKAYIYSDSPFGGYCPALKPPSGYEDHAKNIATHLSNDIVKTFNLNELNDIYNDFDLHGDHYTIKGLIVKLLPRENIITGLANPMLRIRNIIRLPSNEVLNRSPSTLSLISEASSQDSANHMSKDTGII